MSGRNRADIVLHPVRLRILSLLGNRDLTTGKMSALLPDIPQATLYRHLRTLDKASLITVVDSRAVRGTVEKVYGLHKSASLHFDKMEAAAFTKNDHQKYFSAFLGSLLSSFMSVADALDDHPELLDRLGYRTRSIQIPKGKFPDFQKEFQDLLEKYTKTEDGACEGFQLSTVIIPEVDYES